MEMVFEDVVVVETEVQSAVIDQLGGIVKVLREPGKVVAGCPRELSVAQRRKASPVPRRYLLVEVLLEDGVDVLLLKGGEAGVETSPTATVSSWRSSAAAEKRTLSAESRCSETRRSRDEPKRPHPARSGGRRPPPRVSAFGSTGRCGGPTCRTARMH